MSRKKVTHYAVVNGTPLCYADKQFGRFLVPCTKGGQPALFTGFNAKKRLLRIIAKTERKREELKKSVVFDWPALKPLIDSGAISTEVLK